MNNKVNGYGVGVVCVAVTRRSVFPDLMPFEASMSVPSKRAAMATVDQVRASCKKYLASLPLFEFFVLVPMMMLASA